MTAVFERGGDYTEAVLDVVSRIPAGQVMTYGDVAWTFGHPGARAVGMVLHYALYRMSLPVEPFIYMAF